MSRPLRALFFTYTERAFGSIHTDLCKALFSRGSVADVLDWTKSYSPDTMGHLRRGYDVFVTTPDEAHILLEYGIPPSQIAIVAHGEHDLERTLLTRTSDYFDAFASFGVVSDFLRTASSAKFKIRRVPVVLPLGVDTKKFRLERPTPSLRSVGYATAARRDCPAGVDIKRGHLARAATEAAGLLFVPADELSFLAMPSYYAGIDALIVSSLSEGFCLPALEAAAAGAAVIATPVGFLPSFGGAEIVDTEPALFVEQATSLLRRWQSSPEDYSTAVGRALAASQTFDWSVRVEAWIDFLSRAQRSEVRS